MKSRCIVTKRFRHACFLTTPAALLLLSVGYVLVGGGAPRTIAAQVNPPAADAARAAPALPAAAGQFAKEYCTRCHNGDRTEANLDLTKLAFEPDDRGNFALWM